MGKTKCLGCGKSLGGVFDGFGVRVIYGQICLSCKKIVENIPNYQIMAPDQMRAAVADPVAALSAAVKPAAQTPNYTVQAQPVPRDEELRQYKRMLDEGLISEEEFIALKKRVLDL